MDLFTAFTLGCLVALAYAVGEYTGRRRREHEIHAKIIDSMLKELQQDHVVQMIGNDIFAGSKKHKKKKRFIHNPRQWHKLSQLRHLVLQALVDSHHFRRLAKQFQRKGIRQPHCA